MGLWADKGRAGQAGQGGPGKAGLSVGGRGCGRRKSGGMGGWMDVDSEGGKGIWERGVGVGARRWGDGGRRTGACWRRDLTIVLG